MPNALSIRSYTKQFDSHAHDYHQMVLTLNGHIDIEVGEYRGKVSVGEAIVIRAQQLHGFSAGEEARFIVADMDALPANLLEPDKVKFAISEALLAYTCFVEKQLQAAMSEPLLDHLYSLFVELLANEPLMGRIDKRIENAIALIHKDLSLNHSNAVLAEAACLGQTQFKKLFKSCTGLSVSRYVINAKMDKAKALLTYTDYPVTRVAFDLGYKDSSAFTRRFTQHFGVAPSQFSQT